MVTSPIVPSQLEAIDAQSAVFRLTAPNPGLMTGPGTNTYIIFQQGRAIIIDPGPAMPEHIEKIIEVVGGADFISKILLTHMHPDHSPAAKVLSKLAGAPIYGIEPNPLDDHQDHSVEIDGHIEEGQVIHFGNLDIQCVLTPGHTDNHVCFFLKQEGLLFTGDHIMQGSTVVIVPPHGNMKHYLSSLSKLKALKLKAIAPGHGFVIVDPLTEIDKLIKHRLKRERKVIRVLRPLKNATLETLTAGVYDDVDVFLHEWASYSLWAHLIKLQDDGRVALNADIWSIQ